MATNSSKLRTNCHARSVSWPLKSSDLQSVVDEQLLAKLTSCSSSSSIAHKLNSLNDLCTSIEDELLVPTTQKALSQDKKRVNELLDGLLGLLEFCSTTKDALSLTREYAKEFQSVLRRRKGDTLGLICAAEDYLSQRNRVVKAILKALGSLRKQGSFSFMEENQKTIAITSLLKEMESTTHTIFESLSAFILGSNSQSKVKGWSLVSKLVSSKGVQSQQTSQKSEVEKVDDQLFTLARSKARKLTNLDMEMMHKQIGEMELILQELEGGVEALCRHLIRSRVSLLNILNY